MLLADIHNANLTSDERGPQKPEQVDISLLNDLLEESAEKSRIRAFAEEINAHLSEDREGSEPTQLSHTDLNPDNILWAGNGPCLIDWEQACMAYYSVDLMSTGLMWSIRDDTDFDERLFGRFFETYRYTGGHSCDFEFAYWHIVGWGFGWLMHNLRRGSLQDLSESERDKCKRAVAKMTRRILSRAAQRSVLLGAWERNYT